VILKHKDEYPILVNLARHNGLTSDQIVLFLALREMIDGPKGTEYGEFSMKNTNLKTQGICTIERIKRAQQNYQHYCWNRKGPECETFLEFFGLNININTYIEKVKGAFGGES